MSNNELNREFLARTDSATKAEVLNAIADHYGITRKAAEDEVTQEGAEHLLDYLTGSTRSATFVLMQRYAALGEGGGRT